MQFIIIQKTAALFLIIAMLFLLFSGCALNKPQPEDTISMLENAINTYDIESFLQCMDSTWADHMRFLLASIGKSGPSADYFITLIKTAMPILPFISNRMIHSDDFPQVKLTVLKTDLADQTATVLLSGILSWGGHDKPFSATVNMKLENNTWVICGLD